MEVRAAGEMTPFPEPWTLLESSVGMDAKVGKSGAGGGRGREEAGSEGVGGLGEAAPGPGPRSRPEAGAPRPLAQQQVMGACPAQACATPSLTRRPPKGTGAY